MTSHGRVFQIVSKGRRGIPPVRDGKFCWGDFLGGGGSLRKVFIQAVSLMSVFEKRLSFGMFKNAGRGLKVM